MTRAYNPILPGFNPDPSILCVEGDYYIATSTFEWFPGVQIHHSRDLINWKVIERPLKTKEQLDMAGNAFSDGVWAPCLSYNKGIFYLVFTNVRSSQVYPFKDTHNYICTAKDIHGPWSLPQYVNSSGFDPSLFHDDDGKKWFINMEWDHRKQGKEQFSGILLQEYDVINAKLIGEIYKISKGTHIGLVEGPHLYKKDGYYYLVTAEGGTSYQHAICVKRSKNIIGPYEEHPHNPLLTSWLGDWTQNDNTTGVKNLMGDSYIKKAGHGSWCQGPNGEWYLVHLGGRPLENQYSCVLGRETSIQEMVWKEDGWCYLKHGGNKPMPYITVDAFIEKVNQDSKEYRFDTEEFWEDFQTLRVPAHESYISINKRPGYLRMVGRESIYSRFEQSLIARRQTNFNFEVITTMEFKPTSFQHMAGLIYRYNEENQYYLFMSYDEREKYTLNVVAVNDNNYQLLESIQIKTNCLKLKLVVQGMCGQYFYSEDDGENFKPIGKVLDTTILSDEYAKPMGFTGSFVGLAVQDLQNQQVYADFKGFSYKNI